ncbi:hypothetical protein EVB91_207 [Rhizobium phage RHph_I1_18]|nr:hypothetical protein EVB91_207 [Rhizobium phage RHph_I1_18]
MKKRLTPNQKELLRLCAERSFGDGSGAGFVALDGKQERSLGILAALGLVVEPLIYHFTGARITIKGREALKNGFVET